MILIEWQRNLSDCVACGGKLISGGGPGNESKGILHCRIYSVEPTSCSSTELIFVTNYICGEKLSCGEIWGKLGKVGKLWEVLENFWEILPQFTRFHVERN